MLSKPVRPPSSAGVGRQYPQALAPLAGGRAVAEDFLALCPASEGEEVVFVTLDDETGTVNVIVWKSQRDELLKWCMACGSGM